MTIDMNINCELAKGQRLHNEEANHIKRYAKQMISLIICALMTTLMLVRADANDQLLANAVGECNPAEIKRLIADGADANIEPQHESIFLHWVATTCNSSEIIKMLIDTGINVNVRDENEGTPLFRATHKGQVKAAIALIEAGANLNTADEKGKTPLHAAAILGYTEIASVLIEAGANLNTVDQNKWTPLHWAILQEQTKIAIALIEAGANLNAVDKDGWTPLHFVAEKGQPDIATALVEAGAYLSATTNAEITPLDWARHRKNWDVVAILENSLPTSHQQPPQGRFIPNIGMIKPPEAVGTAELVFEIGWRSIVFIASNKKRGSGVIVSPNTVATNCHIIEKGIIKIYKAANRNQMSDKAFPATVRRRDEKNDFCLLNVPGLQGIPVNVRKYDDLRKGENVYGIGAPKGLPLSLTDGVISRLGSFGDFKRTIQTNTAISPGSSGGGLFDHKGNLIGIMTFKLIDDKVEGIGFAIPADLALE